MGITTEQLHLPDIEKEGLHIFLATPLIRLYGKQREEEFYKVRLREFLELFDLTVDEIEILINDFDFSKILPQVTLDPTNQFYKWELINNIISDPFCDSIHFGSILFSIFKYDLRVSISIFYSLGLLPFISSNADFNRFFEVSSNFLPDNVDLGLDGLYEELLLDEFPKVTPSKLKKLKVYLRELSTFDNNKLLRFKGGQLITGDSSTYKLAKLIVSGKKLDYSKLSDTQKRFIQMFTEELSTTGTFVSYFEIASRLEVSNASLHNNILDILDKLSSKKIYIRASNEKIHEVKEDSPFGEFLLLSISNPLILENPNLNDIHRKYLSLILESKDDKGIYDSLKAISTRLDVTPSNYTHIIQDALDRITLTNEDNLYFDASGGRVAQNEARMKLLKLAEDANFLDRIPEDKIDLVILLLERQGKRFSNSYIDIANFLCIDAANPDRAITSQIFRLMENLEAEFVDDLNRIIIKSYLRLLELIKFYSLSEKVMEKMTINDIRIVQRIMKKDDFNRYPSYETLASEFECNTYNIRDVVTRTLKKFEEVTG